MAEKSAENLLPMVKLYPCKLPAKCLYVKIRYVTETSIFMGRNYHTLSIDATMVSKKLPNHW